MLRAECRGLHAFLLSTISVRDSEKHRGVGGEDSPMVPWLCNAHPSLLSPLWVPQRALGLATTEHRSPSQALVLLVTNTES